MPTSFPIYILDLSGEDRIVLPENREDLSHSEFWESVAAGIVAEHYRLPARRLKNLPYCQRRARMVLSRNKPPVIYYGEQQNDELLAAIAAAVDLPDLVWRYDDHEKRLEYDVSKLRQLIDARRLAD